jgi:hypothetical protein
MLADILRKTWVPVSYGILTPLPMVIWPAIHGILTPLPMVYRTPYPWYFDPPAYLLIRNEGGQNTTGVQFTIQGGGVSFQ